MNGAAGAARWVRRVKGSSQNSELRIGPNWSRKEIMEVLLTLVVLAAATLFTAVLLWLAMKIVRVQGSFLLLLLASAIAAVAGLIPYAGGLLSFVVLIVLLNRWTDMDNWVYALLMVVVARGLAILIGIGLYTLIQ